MSKKLFLSTCLMLGAANAQAQTDTLKGIADPVVVTANKYPQKQSATGKVVTVIGRDQIEKNTGKTVAQLLNEQAGIVVNGALNNTGAVQTVYMRGASSGRTLILLDGIPVNDPSMINNEFDLNLFSLDNIDRIEVCRGAQSTLYGSDAIAGVINLITVDGAAKKPLNLKATLSGGSFGTLKANAQVYGNTGKFSYSTRFAVLRTDGFSAAHDSTGTRHYDNDGYNGTTTNAQVKYQATEQLSFRSFFMYSQYKADIDAGVFADEKDYRINNNSLTSGAGFNYKKDVVTLTGTYQYNALNRTYLNDSGFKSNLIFEDNRYYGKSQFVELYATIALGSGFTLLQGADYRYSSYNQQYASVSSFGPYNSRFKDTSLSQSGLYASLNYIGLNNKLTVELGGRINTHSRYGNNSTYTFNPSYALHKKVRIFASVASGFKAPTLYQLSINSQLLPEKSVNYEGGVQLQGEKINSRLVYFNRHINNGIDYNYITFKYFNYIQQRVGGLEYELSWKPVDKLSVAANYTFLSPKETTQNRLTNKDTITYDYLLRRPNHAINTTVGWQVTNALFVSLSGRYITSRHDVGGYAKRDVLLNDYLLLGAFAEYQLNEKARLFADVQNASNKRFFDVRGYNSIPRMINAGISIKW